MPRGTHYTTPATACYLTTALLPREGPTRSDKPFEGFGAGIGRSIEDVYNTKRPRSSTGYLPPVEFGAAEIGELTLSGVR